jgi:hypothetical protein
MRGECLDLRGCFLLHRFHRSKITALRRASGRIVTRFARAVAFPFRPLTIFDGLLASVFRYAGYSICMVAVKPRFRG